ncbi:MAG: FtsQ-type POTRA domain-containing protein [Candidatus Caenarcaniphilales bacterium]|nr:FtsQ-type POTRA domain-containing protein [Candidatus Caenarcaniphilales bacterium]
MLAKNKLLLIISNLALSAIAFSFLYLLTRPITSPFENIEILGLEYVPADDLLNKLKPIELEKHSHMSLDKRLMEELLLKNPFIQSVKIRSILLPETKIQILPKEIDILMYQSQGSQKVLFDKEGNAYPKSIEEFEYISALKDLDKIPELFCPYDLITIENLKILSNSINLIEKNLRAIDVNEKIVEIYSSPDGSFRLTGENYDYRIGRLNSETEKKVKRIEIVLEKIKELLDKRVKLKYIDLSLNTKDVILGK